jgi:hypothetical protein
LIYEIFENNATKIDTLHIFVELFSAFYLAHDVTIHVMNSVRGSGFGSNVVVRLIQIWAIDKTYIDPKDNRAPDIGQRYKKIRQTNNCKEIKWESIVKKNSSTFTYRQMKIKALWFCFFIGLER